MTVQHKAIVLEQTYLEESDQVAIRTTIPELFLFTPGQYTILNFGTGDPDVQTDARYVSMANAPHEKSLLFVMNSGPSEFKQQFKALHKGSEILLGEPGGSFFVPPKAQSPAVYLAGGIGITPIRSIIQHRLSEGSPGVQYLFYSDKNKSSSIFYDEFLQAAKTHQDFHFIPAFAQGSTSRRIDAAMIAQHVSQLKQAQYYIAGSHPFIRGMQTALTSLAVPQSQISMEVFCGYCPDHVCCCEYIGIAHKDHS